MGKSERFHFTEIPLQPVGFSRIAREFEPQRPLDALRQGGAAFEKHNNRPDPFAPARKGEGGFD
jgi:hypothetical protein